MEQFKDNAEYKNGEQIRNKIEELGSEIEILQNEKLNLEILEITRKNTEILHETFCTKNYTGGSGSEGCEWSHEIKDGVVDWEGPIHKYWFEKANVLLHAGYRILDVVRIKDLMNLKMDDK